MVLEERRRRRTAGFLLSELEPSHASGQCSETGSKRRSMTRRAGKTRGTSWRKPNITVKLESKKINCLGEEKEGASAR